ncbi:MAG: dTDP-4-dehydrorhamnose reductase [Planctomycetaceae bacterium]
MRIAVIGAYGQLGSDVVRALGSDAVPLGRSDFDITDCAAVSKVLTDYKPDSVINLAAYNLVDRAEQEPDVALKVNALGARTVAQFCGRNRLPLLHVSTDHIFGLDGDRQTPYIETDLPGPVNAYGLSKLSGEYSVLAESPQSIIVRTCGLYGRTATRSKGNFVETMLKLAKARTEINVVADQVCTPTSTSDLAPILVRLLREEATGIYHVTNGGEVTWADFAREIFRLAGLDIKVNSISSAEYGAAARRPAYSVLKTDKVCRQLNVTLADWRDALKRYLQEGKS